MDKTFAVALVTGVASAIIGALSAYIGAVVKYRKELESEFDREIRKERIRAYPELWRHLELLARYDRPAPLDVRHLQTLSVAMRKWYFESGGIFLSDFTRVSYFDLKGRLQRAIDSLDQKPDGPTEVANVPELIGAASLLRAHLTKDLGSRRSSPVADS